MPDRAETLCHYALLRASCSARIVNKKLCEARASGRPKSCGNVAVSHLRLPTTWVQMASPEIAPELTGHGLPLSKCEAYNRVYQKRGNYHRVARLLSYNQSKSRCNSSSRCNVVSSRHLAAKARATPGPSFLAYTF